MTPSREDPSSAPPSWLVGLCGVAAFASCLFCVLLFINL